MKIKPKKCAEWRGGGGTKMADNFADIIGDILVDILRTGPKDVQVPAKNVSIRPPLPSPPPPPKKKIKKMV